MTGMISDTRSWYSSMMLWRATRQPVRRVPGSLAMADIAEKKILVERAQAIEKEVWQKFNGSTANDYRQSEHGHSRAHALDEAEAQNADPCS
jgi:hypothetical protein